MATKGGSNMYEVCNDYKVINSFIFIGTCWMYSHDDMQLTLTHFALQADWKRHKTGSS
jgi:hypothetical protein